MVDHQGLLKDLQRRVRMLEDDLREQVETHSEIGDPLKQEHTRAHKLNRTAATWTQWRDERVTQAAAGWVLGTVFVRFCEDNGLLGQPFLAAPTPDRMTLAEEAQAAHFRARPHDTDRDWLLAGFAAMAVAQAGRLLFDPEHNALYRIPISHDAAKSLIGFWRRRDDDGRLTHDFTNPEWDTRFLGDLYQDLSEAARKRYALLQTPEFVEEFILDLTLTPAINEFGHDVVKVIDPTCGSGHFLLGAFCRLLAEWEREAPGRDLRERVGLALSAVHGVDINPFAVAIARFRLLLAAMRACGFTTLKTTEGYDFPIHIAIGDSLLKDKQLALFDDLDLFGDSDSDGDELAAFRYAVEDLDEHDGILTPGRYHVVVGNPPYITVKDKSLNQEYRERYNACSGKYALSVPFAQRFFELAKPSSDDGRGAGYVGQITANSFMKREFGKKLIQEFFSKKVDLTHVIDTSGAYIPGHGTPTVILAGRNRSQHRADTVRAVRGVQGEPGKPTDAYNGLVWQAILDQIDTPGSTSKWVSVDDLGRKRYFKRFPWVLEDGGLELLEEVGATSDSILNNLLPRPIGFASFPGQDEAYIAPRHWFRRQGIDAPRSRPLVIGEVVRSWGEHINEHALVPYEEDGSPTPFTSQEPWGRHLHTLKRVFDSTTGFDGSTRGDSDAPWWTWYRWVADRYRTPLSIAFAFVATHNHFVLDRGGKVFKQSAPVIKLPEGATEDDHLRLLGVLNSSTACFWLKQVSQAKGGSGLGRGIQDEEWENRYEFTGTKLQEFPLPGAYPLELARQLDSLAQRLSASSPAAVCADGVPTRDHLARARDEWHAIRGQMIALQEELDWQVYALYGLLDTEFTVAEPPELKLGERAFEIVLARRVAAGEAQTEWFARHGSTPITQLPERWPQAYREMVLKRIEVIEQNRSLALIERPECKRRWQTDGWDAMQAAALRDWLLDRCEARELWRHHVDGVKQPRPLTVNQLADELRRDPDVLAVAELHAPGKDLAKVLESLIADEHVPFLAALRHKPPGLAKRAEWENVWGQQRAEDAEPDEQRKRTIRDAIPVPPKYAQADFAKPSYWRNRGKLDVAKERFISYPGCGRDGDPSLLLGWAGWDHREQAQALAMLTVEREQNDGWGAERLAPLLAGLREVLFWVEQWHGDYDPVFGVSPAAAYQAFLNEATGRLHLTDEDLASWRPPAGGRRRK